MPENLFLARRPGTASVVGGPGARDSPFPSSSGPALTKVLGMRPTLENADPEEKGIQHPRSRNRRGRRFGGLCECVRTLSPTGGSCVQHLAFRVRTRRLMRFASHRLEICGYPTAEKSIATISRASIFANEIKSFLNWPPMVGSRWTRTLPIWETRLALPPFLEGRRAEIEANLKPL